MTLKVVTPREVEVDGETVTQYDFRCPYPTGCGGANPDGEHAPFASAGWASEDDAVARGKQHVDEHETGEPMPDLDTFRTARGLTSATAGATNLPDDWEF